MTENQVLQELYRYRINITKCEEPIISWHESCLAVLTEKGLHIYELAHNISCLDVNINCIQTLISHPKYSPASSLFTNRIINKDLSNLDQTEMIIDHALWPHNRQLLQEMSTIVDFKWSPAGSQNNEDFAIAVMTNVGVVEIYKQNLNNWTCTIEISNLLHLESGMIEENPRLFNTLKESAYTLATMAICWSSTLINDNKDCYLITAQKNGCIIIWLIQNNVKAKVQGSFNSGTSEIQAMKFILLNDIQFLIVCSNILGQIIVYKCEIQNEVFKLLDSNLIWEHKDRMVASHIQHVELDNKLVLVFNKHRHLGILMLNQHCTVVGQYVNNINDYRLTSITNTSEGIHITTVNCTIYKLDMAMVDSELDMRLNAITCQNLSSTHELYSLSYSRNGAICALSAIDRKIKCKKGFLSVEVLLMSAKEKMNSLFDILMSNPTKQLTHYWDVAELLRYNTMKTKELPTVQFTELYEMGCSDTYLLKVYLILCILCDNLKKLCKISPDFYLPENSINIIKEEILVAHADRLIQKYVAKYREENVLDAPEIQYFIGAKKFLEYYFQKSKKNLIEVMDLKILCIFDTDVSYICQCCDELVSGFTCKNEHLNMFCALTLTPINDDNYLVCKWCNLTARSDLLIHNPLCLFCDVPLRMIEL